MNTAHPGPAADDSGPDPTGMREVLAALPDPGPMPDHVVVRIQHSMARERAHASRESWAGNYDTEPAAVDLLAERQRRRSAQWLLAAAAVVAVGLMGIVIFDQVLAPGSAGDSLAHQESDDQGGNAAADEPGGAESGAAADGDPPDQGARSADALSGDEAVSNRGEPLAETFEAQSDDALLAEIDDGAFLSGALLLLQGSGTSVSALPEEFAGTPSPDPLSAASVDSCVQAVGEDPSDGQWAAVEATINGADAIVVGDLTPDRSRVWAVADHCPADAGAEIFHGPVSLP